ncbi:MAG TPA: GMC oxidoreductase [Novosphingobium sp.]
MTVIVMHDVATPTDLSERLHDAFVAAGLGQRGDSNGVDPFVTDRYQTMFASGIRRTIADDFLTDEVRSRANFTIVTNAQVNRVLVDSGRAIGVEVRDADGIRSITAGREVILCAGTFNTPQILMLSGIGPRDHLEELGIEVLVDAPAVGANLQDHVYTHIYTLAAAGVEGSVAPGMGEEDISAWLCDHTGPSGYFSENGVGWAALNGGSIPDIELLFSYTTTSANFGGITDAGRRSGTSIGVALLQPASRGTLRLASSDPTVKPVIDPCYLSEDADVTALVAGLRIAHRIAYEPVLAPWAQSVFSPITATDAELAAHVRRDATTVFHPVGTMRMGAEDDPTAAVDAELRVKGISGLRVVDASVMPRLIRGHTMAPTVVIAYRAADIINGQNMIVRR